MSGITMSFRALAFTALAANLMTACVPVPIPLIVPVTASGQPLNGQPVERLGQTQPQSATVDAALNKARTAAGSGPLVSNSGLDRVAAQYAAELAQGDKLMMGTATGPKASARIKAAGVSTCPAGEVISQGYPTASAALSAWLSDPMQSKSLMNPAYANYGFGHAADRAGRGADVWVIVLLRACAA
ncbi:CAP domain-containing protein [Loktanella sp. M215]|uniref:CAP domain-containing protein n=1 Tax=Loktanella sp. M215 TaxID=2675431 RepID=UPI001F3BEF04|nr:CAP domain-containing protein [Loktanella sp. M215]